MNDIFRLLANVSHCHFDAHSLAGSQMNWQHRATGEIKSELTASSCLEFNETLHFADGRVVRETKRWCVVGDKLEFWRLRHHGYEKIFTLIPQGENTWVAEHIYWCAPDEYAATLMQHQQQLELEISIKSQRKNERLRYVYFQAA